MENLTVLSLGGSLIVPDNVDSNFLKGFREMILKHSENKERFILVTGGGSIARKYIQASKEIRELEHSDHDWIGVYSTRFNAEFIRILFKEVSHPEIMTNPHEKLKFDEPILIGAGWKPGFSTDYDAVVAATTFGAKRILNLSNIDYVYDSDPKKNKDAKPYEKLTWKEFRDIIGDEWKAGLHLPLDPSAAKHAQENGLEVVIINGNNIENLNDCLSGKQFKGTMVSG